MSPYYAGVAERIANFNPQARFVYLMRDPVERTVSHYWHMVRHHGERRGMLRAIQEDSRYQDFSNYHFQITKYIKIFGYSNIWCATYERLARDPEELLRELLRWLDVDPDGIPLRTSPKNVTPRYVSQARGPEFLGRFRYSGLWNLVGPYVPDRVRRLGRYMTESVVDRHQQPIEDVARYLRPIQLPQVEDLSRLLGREFPEWKTLYGADATPPARVTNSTDAV
jgi:hypothetical protein